MLLSSETKLYMNNENTPANRKYKDTIFRILFSESKENALSLYNAVNGSNYTDADELEFTVLEDVIFMNVKNDNSFIFSGNLNVYEHQSTINPNMPLRGLFYFSALYRKINPKTSALYSEKLLKIPTPRYIVFYNGVAPSKDIVKLKLSDMFIVPDKSGDFEWTATMININSGHNKEMVSRCKLLEDYSAFIDRVRRYKQGLSLKNALIRAIDECISEGILADFLRVHRNEVLEMTLTEFDENEFEEMLREEGRIEGRLEGQESGQLTLLNKLIEEKRLTLPEAAEMLGISAEEFTGKVKNLNL